MSVIKHCYWCGVPVNSNSSAAPLAYYHNGNLCYCPGCAAQLKIKEFCVRVENESKRVEREAAQ